MLAVQHEGNEEPHNVSWLDYLDYKDKSGAFEELAAYNIDFVGMSADNRAERVTVSYVTSNYFSMLGVPPALGRVLQPGDPVQPGPTPFIVLGHTYWKKRFNGDPAVVGRARARERQAVHRRGRRSGVVRRRVCARRVRRVPAALDGAPDDYKDLTTKRDEHSLHVIGPAEAGDRARSRRRPRSSVLAQQLETQFPDTNKTVRARVIPERLARPEANSADQHAGRRRACSWCSSASCCSSPA